MEPCILRGVLQTTDPRASLRCARHLCLAAALNLDARLGSFLEAPALRTGAAGGAAGKLPGSCREPAGGPRSAVKEGSGCESLPKRSAREGLRGVSVPTAFPRGLPETPRKKSTNSFSRLALSVQSISAGPRQVAQRALEGPPPPGPSGDSQAKFRGKSLARPTLNRTSEDLLAALFAETRWQEERVVFFVSVSCGRAFCPGQTCICMKVEAVSNF